MLTSNALQGPKRGAVCVWLLATLQVQACCAQKCELLALAAAVYSQALPEEGATLAIWHLHRKCIKGSVCESSSPKGVGLLARCRKGLIPLQAWLVHMQVVTSANTSVKVPPRSIEKWNSRIAPSAACSSLCCGCASPRIALSEPTAARSDSKAIALSPTQADDRQCWQLARPTLFTPVNALALVMRSLCVTNAFVWHSSQRLIVLQGGVDMWAKVSAIPQCSNLLHFTKL